MERGVSQYIDLVFIKGVRPKPDSLHRLCKLFLKLLGFFNRMIAFADGVLKMSSPPISLAQLEQNSWCPLSCDFCTPERFLREGQSTDGEGEKAVDLISF
jgi:hypothetical protein